MCSLSLQPNVLYLWPESAENEYLPLFRDLRWQVTSLLPPTTTLQSPFLPFFPNSCPLNLTTTECMAHFGFSLMFRVRDTSTQILGGASMGVASLFWFYLFLTLRVCISQGEPKKQNKTKTKTNKNKQKNPHQVQRLTHFGKHFAFVPYFLAFTIQSLCPPPWDFHSIK